MIIDRLRKLFGGDAFVPTAAVFPDIDADAIARSLRLRDRARERGAADLPRPEEESLDGVEMEILGRVEEARRKGLQNYETNKDVYARRLSRASTASLEVRSVAGAALGDFESEVKAVRGHMTGYVKDLTEWHRALEDFRRRHRLRRPAFKPGNWLAALTILLLCVLLETVLNGYLFAQRNELGLLGGGLVALLVSCVNVTGSTLGGLSTRILRHANWLAKAAGLLMALAWAGFLLGFNLAVAHFRDAVETLSAWAEAATRSLDTLLSDPLSLNSIESWLLMLVGVLVGLLAFLKFVSFGEPYPGYSRISRRFDRALDDYAAQLEAGLGSLEGKRDDAIEALKDAHDIVRENIGDAVDALYGHRAMRAQLAAFLEQCDVKVQTLLKLYRDENRAARETPAPAHFDREFRFTPFADAELDMTLREDARRELSEIGRIVDEAVAAIHDHYRRLQADYPDPDVLIGLDLRASSRTEAEAAPEPPPRRALAAGGLAVVDGGGRG